MEELIKQGAAQEAKDNRGGYTPLHLAADAGQCEVISRLCELGADLEAVSTKGWTPLALANMKVGVPKHNAFCSLQVPGVLKSARIIVDHAYCTLLSFIVINSSSLSMPLPSPGNTAHKTAFGHKCTVFVSRERCVGK